MIDNMDASKHWLMLRSWVIIVFLISYALCKPDIKSLMTRRCNIQTNTNGTVKFDCHGRKLSVMPQVYLNTTNLDVSENNIKKLTVDSMKDLQKLISLSLNWMNQNQHVNISKGVFTNLTSLEILELNGVGLPKVPVHLPNSLKQIRLDENNISSLGPKDFLQLHKLTHLYLSKNCYYRNPCLIHFNIENGTFSHLNKLKHLSLSYNNITHVPKCLPTSLVTLELASNMISIIREDDFKGLPKLKTLKIQGNCPRCHNAPYPCISCANGSIDIHERAFDNLANLRLLHLAGNSISIIKKAWFENLSQLQELYLSFNYLTSQIEDGAFLSNLRLLRKLDLSYNYQFQVYPETVKLAPAFANLQSLRILHIQALVFKKIQNDTLASLYGLQNLSMLDIGVNFIVAVDPNIFNQFPNLKLLYLSENRLYPNANAAVTNPNYNMMKSHFDLSGFTDDDSKNSLEPYNINKQLVKPECFAAGPVLDMSRNNLFFISPKQFEDYKHISCLNLSRNGFSSALNGTEFTSLPKLKYLDLSFNKIDLAYDYAFEELKELEVLDLSFNQHYFLLPGVTHNLKFLQNLPKLRVLNMSSNNIFTLTSKYMCSNSLVELQFQKNQLGRLWRDKTYVQLFWNLTNLTHLDVSHNYIINIPEDVYKYLPVTIKRFRLNHNALTSLNWTLMRSFTQLEELILSYNYLTHVSQNITQNIPSLFYIDLSHNRISQLATKMLQGAFNLKMLDLSYNKLSAINQSTFPYNATNLSTLWLHKNPYRCTCDILEFILWISKTNVKIPYLYSLVNCNAPSATNGQPVMGFDIMECIDSKLSFSLYLFSTLLVLGITFVSTLMHVFYWDFSYVFYYLKAKLGRYQQLSYEDNIYDAFVTYDTKDRHVSEWVLNHLRVQLEEKGDCFLPVCLEERDWLPGCPILDSLTQSIRKSRKTIFVLTQSYVRSGLFKMAIYLAHQRLLDESEDVIVLLLLEPVLQNSHFMRLRRRLCSHSVLEWPQTPAAEPWFWQCLRNVVQLENKIMYNNIYSRYFTITKRPRERE